MRVLSCGFVASLFGGAFCCLTCLFLFIPLMPLIFLPCWFLGGLIASILKKDKKYIDTACLWSIIIFTFVCPSVLFVWMYHEDMVGFFVWSLSSISIFTGCSYAAKYTVGYNKLT